LRETGKLCGLPVFFASLKKESPDKQIVNKTLHNDEAIGILSA